MQAATSWDPNYFPNDADDENNEEESDDISLVGDGIGIWGAGVDEENVSDQNVHNVLEDLLNQRDIQEQSRFKSSEPVHENHNKNRKRQDAWSYETPVYNNIHTIFIKEQ